LAGVYVYDAPPVFWDVATALEDKRFCDPASSSSSIRLALASLGAWAKRRGGSTLTMQLASNLGRWKIEERDRRSSALTIPGYGAFLTLRRKVRELANAPVLYQGLRAENCLELKRWAATHLPLVSG